MREIFLRSIGSIAACQCLLFISQAGAAPISVFLQGVTIDDGQSQTNYSLTNSTAVFQYETSTGILTSTGEFFGAVGIGPAGKYAHSITDFSLDNTLLPSATAYECLEGTLGGTLNRSYCGNYNYGPNNLDESATVYSGTAYLQTIGGDDISEGPLQSLNDYQMNTRSWDGINLVYTGNQMGDLTMIFGTLPGATQQNPIIPSGNPAAWVFTAVSTNAWVDPPLTDSYTYTMTSTSLFTDILDFPTGFDDPFCVNANSQNLGCFGAGDPVDFIALLGAGVSEFTVFNIGPTVDVEDPQAFPLQLAFDTPTASFIMTATVPVPGAVWLFVSALGLLGWTRRKAM